FPHRQLARSPEPVEDAGQPTRKAVKHGFRPEAEPKLSGNAKGYWRDTGKSSLFRYFRGTPENPTRLPRVRGPEDGRPGHEDPGSGLGQGRGIARADPAVHRQLDPPTADQAP